MYVRIQKIHTYELYLRNGTCVDFSVCVSQKTDLKKVLWIHLQAHLSSFPVHYMGQGCLPEKDSNMNEFGAILFECHFKLKRALKLEIKWTPFLEQFTRWPHSSHFGSQHEFWYLNSMKEIDTSDELLNDN